MFVNARLPGHGQPVTLHVENGRFCRVAPPSVPPEGDTSPPPLNLEGAFVLPGLWDTHLHFCMWSLGLARLQLAGCPNREALLQAVRATPGEWVIGQGWSETGWPDPRLPTRLELDAAGGGRPVVLLRADLHSAVASTAALQHARLTADTRGLVERQDGELTGRVLELAVASLLAALPQPSRAELERALRLGTGQLHRLGVTGIVDQRMPEGEELPFDLYRELRLPLRIHCNRAPGHAPPGPGDDWVRPGHVKLFSDGSMGSRTARMLEPYVGTNDRGIWITPPEQLREHFVRTRREGDRLSIHAIGNEALRVVLDLFEELGVIRGDRIEHVQLLADADLERLARLGLVASMQPVHLLDDEVLARRLFGDEARLYYRLKGLANCGTRLAFGSDAPVADPSPWLGLQAAIHRRPPGRSDAFFPAERLSPEQALAAYTSEAAATLDWPGLGRLEAGCHADFIAVDRDPLACEDLTEVRVLRTVVAGETVYSA